MHILFVDDTSDTRQLFSMAFVLEGHRCETAHTALGGLDLLLRRAFSRPFDAVVLDIEMPGMNGLDLLKSIKTHPHIENTVVVMFTAYEDPAVEGIAKEMGAYACLRKPLFPKNVVDVVTRAVSVDREARAGHV